MVFNVLGLLLGILILAGGIYYLMKEKQDKDSQKIYKGVCLIGGIIALGMAVKIMLG